jgi:hypothetical protein
MPSSRARRSRLALLPGLLLALPPGPGTLPRPRQPQQDPGQVIERVLAVVDGRPVMLSEVEVVERFRGLGRVAALDSLIDEQLMFRDAARLSEATVTGDEAEAAYASLLEKGPSPRTDDERDLLRRLARRQAVILRYIDFRFRPQVRVEDADVARAYAERYAGSLDAPSLPAVTAELRQQLERQDLDRRVEAWIRTLRDAAQIRYNR